MYCANCGVKLGDAEEFCPLCGVRAYHPDILRPEVQPLYPKNIHPRREHGSGALGGVLIALFLLPIIICFLCDLQGDGRLQWFGYVAGALILAYIVFALPLWFAKPHPIIFLPCDFAAAILYLLYIQLATGGSWFLGFAFPVAGALALVSCAVVTLLVCLRKGQLYVIGGGFMALGLVVLLTEFLLCPAFGIGFIGWSFYPLAALCLLGGLMIFLAINGSAREMMERKLFF